MLMNQRVELQIHMVGNEIENLLVHNYNLIHFVSIRCLIKFSVMHHLGGFHYIVQKACL